jgi:hypothetical protein
MGGDLMENNNIYKDILGNIGKIREKINLTPQLLHTYGLLYFIELSDFFEYFYFPVISQHQKNYYGEVNTPFKLSGELVSFLELETCREPPTILDSGAGLGYISAVVVKTLFNAILSIKGDKREELWKNIMNHITLVEINEENVKILRLLFGDFCNIICGDYLNYFPSLKDDNKCSKNNGKYDIVIGNPPFNINGTIKVPTNNGKSKKEDGKSIWREFVIHSLNYCLSEGGKLCYFIPSLWLKSDDKSDLHGLLLRENKLLKMKCYDNTSSNSLFKGHAQTHCGCFLIQKGGKTDCFQHYSYYLNDYSECSLSYRGNIKSIGVLDSVIERKIINKLKKEFSNNTIEFKPLLFNKTSTLSKKISISKTKTHVHTFPNIQTCVFSRKEECKQFGVPVIKYDYSDVECPFYGKSKIVLAHGMYGIPFIDEKGEYGISRRDKYVILEKNVGNMECLAWFLSTPICSFMFENYKYRMCFLEKAGFEWLVDISLLIDKGFPYKNIKELYKWFYLNDKEIEYIGKFERKQFIV